MATGGAGTGSSRHTGGEAVSRQAGGTGSQRALRAANTRRVLATLAEKGPMPQADLSRATGLSAATISNIVGRLRAQGLVTTAPTTSSGRRALLVQLGGSRRDRVAVGVDIGRTHIRLVLADQQRQVVAEDARVLAVGFDADTALATTCEMLDALLAQAGLDRDDVVGCGVGIPGPIDARTGRISHGVILPTWVGFSPAARLGEALGLPVHLDNDANLGALAEITWGPHAQVRDLIFLKVATGIGAGLVLDGTVYRGAMGITGEVGHIPIDGHGPVCRCGNRGCLETVASTDVMVQALARTGALPREADVAGLVRLVEDGDPAAGRVLEDAGLAIGQVLGGLVNVLNPAVVVLGGPLLPLGDRLLGPVRQGLLRFASPTVGMETCVAASSLGERAEALGACSLVFARTSPEEWARATDTAS